MRDAVLLNAAGALVAADGIGAGRRARWPTRSPAALKRAAAAIDTGAARDVLDRWVALSTPGGAGSRRTAAGSGHVAHWFGALLAGPGEAARQTRSGGARVR